MGDDIEFNSADVMAQNKTYSFLETNTIEVEDQLIDYLSFELMDDKRKLAHKTIFIQEAVSYLIFS